MAGAGEIIDKGKAGAGKKIRLCNTVLIGRYFHFYFNIKYI